MTTYLGLSRDELVRLGARFYTAQQLIQFGVDIDLLVAHLMYIGDATPLTQHGIMVNPLQHEIIVRRLSGNPGTVSEIVIMRRL